MFKKICVVLLLGVVANVAQANDVSEQCENALTLAEPLSNVFENLFQAIASIMQTTFAQEEVAPLMEEWPNMIEEYMKEEKKFNQFTKKFIMAIANVWKQAIDDMDREKAMDAIQPALETMAPIAEKTNEIMHNIIKHYNNI